MKLHPNRIILLGFAVLGLLNLNGQAQLVTPVFQNETNQPGYITQDYKFTGIDAENYPTYPELSTGGAGVWPAPIAADGGSATATFNHTNSTDTTDFLSASAYGGGIYSFFSETAFNINQTAPLSNLSSLTFQIYQAAGVDSNATNNLYVGLPTLTLNLGNNTQDVITASPGTILSSTPAVVFGQSTSLDDVGFTFDVSGVTQPIDSYTVNWQTATHSITYGFDVTEAEPQAVPEPSTYAMIGLGFIPLFWRFRQKLRKHSVLG